MSSGLLEKILNKAPGNIRTSIHAMKVYEILGHGFVESVYQEALEIEFQRRNIPYKREVEIEVYYDGVLLEKKFRADFVCYDSIIVELKAVSELDEGNLLQLSNYLKATHLRLGLLINFGNMSGVEIERWIN